MLVNRERPRQTYDYLCRCQNYGRGGHDDFGAPVKDDCRKCRTPEQDETRIRRRLRELGFKRADLSRETNWLRQPLESLMTDRDRNCLEIILRWSRDNSPHSPLGIAVLADRSVWIVSPCNWRDLQGFEEEMRREHRFRRPVRKQRHSDEGFWRALTSHVDSFGFRIANEEPEV